MVIFIKIKELCSPHELFAYWASNKAYTFHKCLKLISKNKKCKLIDIKRMLIGDFIQNLRNFFVARTFRLLANKPKICETKKVHEF